MNSFNDSNSWVITAEDRLKNDTQFYSLNPVAGFLSGEQAKFFFLQSGLATQILGRIWNLSDLNMDGKMDKNEFSIAMFLIKRSLKGLDLPINLPPSLLSNPQLQSGMLITNQIPINNIVSSSSPSHSNLYNTMPYHPNTNSQAPRQTYSTMSRGSISLNDWVITPAQRLKYKQVFDNHQHTGYLTGSEARKLLSGSGLTHPVLAQIWCLADIDADGNLSSDEFCVAMHLIDQTKSGFPLPATLPPDLIPPTQRKLRRASEVNSAHVSVAVTAVSSEINSNSMGSSSGMFGNGGMMVPGLSPNQGVIKSESPVDLEPARIVTFEDKRKENFNQGQAELEKRRAMLRESQIQDSEARLSAERVEHEKKEKIRMEQEMKKQHEFERQLDRQRQMEVEKEEERKRILDQKEAARQEMNRQRQADWQKQRQEQLLAERSKCQAAVDQLKQQTGQQRQSLENWREKKTDSMGKVEATRQSLTDVSSTINSIKLLSLSKSTEIDVIASESEEVEMKMVAVEQESLRLRKQMDSSENNMDDTWRELKRERDRKEEGMEEKRKKLEILRESCAKKEEIIRKMEEEVKKKEKNLPAVMEQKPKFDNLFENVESTSSQIPWKQQPTTSTKKWEDLNSDTAVSLKEDAWANVSANQDDKNGLWNSNNTDQKLSWTADFNTTFEGRSAGVKSRLKRYKALYNFNARTHDELSLVEGDVVTVEPIVQSSSEPGWMIGSKNGQTGCFPEAYVDYVDEVASDAKNNGINKLNSRKIDGNIEKTDVGSENKDVFSTLSKAFEEAFSAKKSPTKDIFSKQEDNSSTQPFQALNEVFTSAFGSAKPTKTTSLLDQPSNFDSDFSSINFDKTTFENSNFEVSSFEPTIEFANENTYENTHENSNNTAVAPHTTTSLEVTNLTTMPHTTNKNIDSAIKDILEKSRKTPVSPVPFASSTLIKAHSPSPLTSSSKASTINSTNNTAINSATFSFTSLSTNMLSTTTTTTTSSLTSLHPTTTKGIIAQAKSIFEPTKSTDNTIHQQNNTLTNNFLNHTTPTEATAETANTIPTNTTPAHTNTANTTANTTTANTTTAVMVQAVYAWQAKKLNHLSFFKGDIINKLSEKNTWCYGEFNGQKGWFPKSYVKIIGSSDSPFPDLPPEVKPMNYDGNNNGINNGNINGNTNGNNNSNNNSNNNGNIVIKNAPPTPSINQSDLLNDNQSAITMTTNRDVPGDNNNNEAANDEEFIVVAMYNYVSEVSGDLTFKKGQVFVAQKTDIDWWTGSTDDGRTGIFPSSYVRMMETMTSGKLSENRPEIATAIADYEASGPEQLALKVGQLVHVRKKSKSGWWEGEIQVKGQKRRVGWFPANYVKLLGDDVNSVSNLQPVRTPETNLPSEPDTAEKVGAENVVALYTYTGQTDGDLTFLEGDKITVTKKCSDDWWEGELNGRLGIFPANYVATVTNDVEAKR